jgi:hypothetical protein
MHQFKAFLLVALNLQVKESALLYTGNPTSLSPTEMVSNID